MIMWNLIFLFINFIMFTIFLKSTNNILTAIKAWISPQSINLQVLEIHRLELHRLM